MSRALQTLGALLPWHTFIARTLHIWAKNSETPGSPLTTTSCHSPLLAHHPVSILTAIDTTAFSVSNMFHPNMRALDIFGDKETSDSRRRCQPAREDDDGAKLLFDLHLRVAITYTVAYAGIKAMPYCFHELEAEMEERGHPLSLVFDTETSVDTPWGLAKAYADEAYAFLDENDGWNADGSLSRQYNRVPFSDFAMTDSAGNSYEPYTPINSAYKVFAFFRRDTHKYRLLPRQSGYNT